MLINHMIICNVFNTTINKENSPTEAVFSYKFIID